MSKDDDARDLIRDLNGHSMLTPQKVQPLTRKNFTPRDLDLVHLAKLNHAEWLGEFSQILALNTGVQMTPKREGTITRLHWASLYVKHIERMLKKADEKIAAQAVEIENLKAEDGEGR